jgi:hypothetical protein
MRKPNLAKELNEESRLSVLQNRENSLKDIHEFDIGVTDLTIFSQF